MHNKISRINAPYLMYQPIFKNDFIVGYEALARQGDSEQTIPLLVSSDPLKRGNILVMDIVLKELALNQSRYIHPNLLLFINSHPFATSVLPDLSNNPLTISHPQRIVFEITEHTKIEPELIKNLVRVKSAGFKVAIDDFDFNSHLSLDQVMSISPDFIKLSRNFTEEFFGGNDAYNDLFIELARNRYTCNYEIIVEGIETKDQYYCFKEFDVYMQGFYLSRPVPLNTIVTSNLYV